MVTKAKGVSSFRLSDETTEQLNYLQAISYKSQAAILEDLVAIFYRGVRQEAFFSPGTTIDHMDPTLFKNGGSFISLEEQQALQTVRKRLAGTQPDDGGRP